MKKIILKYSFLLIFVLIYSCGSTVTNDINEDGSKNGSISKLQKSEKDSTPNKLLLPIEEVKMKVRRGDTQAYNQLAIANLSHPDDQVFWALFMAHKYDYKQAYFDVFSCLMSAYMCRGYSLDKMDAKSKKMALDYLQIAAGKGHEQSKEIINDYFPELISKERTNAGD